MRLNGFIIFSSILLIMSENVVRADPCPDWFKDSKINPAAKDCAIQCSTLLVDLGTSECPSRCPEFCKPRPDNCSDTFWEQKIKNGEPAQWPNISERTAQWTSQEKDLVLQALSKLPSIFKDKSLKGFFRKKKPIFLNFGTEATTSDGSIVIYDRAFNSSNPLDRVLAHELTHVLSEKTWFSKMNKYGNQMGWKPGRTRPGLFAKPDARESLEEDFTVSIEFFLFEPQALKEKTPKAFNWIKGNFGKEVELKKGCAHDQ
jgi:hypothetical protein